MKKPKDFPAEALEDPTNSPVSGRPAAPAMVVESVTVRALGKHEHDGVPYGPGAEFEMSPESAELALARGDVELVKVNQTEVQPQ